MSEVEISNPGIEHRPIFESELAVSGTTRELASTNI